MKLDVLPRVSEHTVRVNNQRVARYAGQVTERVCNYLAARGLDGVRNRKHVRLGYVQTPMAGDERFCGHLAIPYINDAGDCVGMRFRRLEGDGPKYTQPKGEKALMYLPQAALRSPIVHLCEGELDTLSLYACGLYASGLPGAQSWRAWYSKLFEGCERLVVWSDGDDAGDEMWEKVRVDVPNAIRAVVPRGWDVNSLLIKNGVDGVKSLIP
ncbi:hypothetical protein [Schaalia sp. ZJ1691]|uniref:toprim domain-containing protein n=1 Tax=Schaalia sp. ZJ1691 TaxID=2709404 RepID=UPI001F14BB9F|nr:hypothetical protein [Schaalia sp. ZJ1691]